jgi:hypothetical protein
MNNMIDEFKSTVNFLKDDALMLPKTWDGDDFTYYIKNVLLEFSISNIKRKPAGGYSTRFMLLCCSCQGDGILISKKFYLEL